MEIDLVNTEWKTSNNRYDREEKNVKRKEKNIYFLLFSHF